MAVTTRHEDGTRTWKCHCGAEVESFGGYDTYCERCGQDYNGFGQALRADWHLNPSNYDDEIGDLEGYEMACRDW